MTYASAHHPNDRPNFCEIILGFGSGSLHLWFSYNTCVAFKEEGEPVTVIENCWGPTTGRHLNMISPSFRRLPAEEFERKFEELFSRVHVETAPTLSQIREEFVKELQDA